MAFWRLLALVSLLATASAEAQGPSQPSAPLVSATSEQWALAQRETIAGTLQVAFPVNLIDRDRNPLVRIWEELGPLFPEYKRNTVGRQPHSTLLYLAGLTLEKIRHIIDLFAQLPQGELERRKLLAPVRLLDLESPEIITPGHESKFLAFKLHAEYRAWQARLWQLIRDFAPELLEGMQLDEEMIHMSLLQYGPAHGRDFADAFVAQTKAELLKMVAAVARDYRDRTGRAPVLYFSPLESTLELVSPPRSIQQPPDTIVAFRPTHAKVEISTIGRLHLPVPGSSNLKQVFEFKTAELLARKASPFVTQPLFNKAWFGASQMREPISIERLRQGLSPQLDAALVSTLADVSPSSLPAFAHPDILVAAETHPGLDPFKAAEIFKRLEGILPQSNSQISVGHMLYASAGRKEYKIGIPSDSDLLVNSIVHVPDSIPTREQAERYAAQQFTQAALGHLRDLFLQKKIAFTDALRIGSSYTLGQTQGELPPLEMLRSLRDHLDLQWQDVVRGYWIDTTGRHRPLAELVESTKDFLKLKLEVIRPDGTHDPYSVQFLVGYHWRGHNGLLQRRGLKVGILSILDTGICSAPSGNTSGYAVGLSLLKAGQLAAVMRGDLVPDALGELLQSAFPGPARTRAPELEAQFTSKTLKRAYNFLGLLARSGLGLDEVFYNETQRFLTRERGAPVDVTLKELTRGILRAVNQSFFTQLTPLKRKVNDLREFSERGDHFTLEQWSERRKTIRVLLAQLKEALRYLPAENPLTQGGSPFQAALSDFETVLTHAESYSEPQRAIRYLRSKRRWSQLLAFEKQLGEVESYFNSRPGSFKALSADHQVFLQTFLSLAPVFYYRYHLERTLDRGSRMQSSLAFLGISPTPEKIGRLENLATRLDTLSRDQVAADYPFLFNSFSDSCVSSLKPVKGVPL